MSITSTMTRPASGTKKRRSVLFFRPLLAAFVRTKKGCIVIYKYYSSDAPNLTEELFRKQLDNSLSVRVILSVSMIHSNSTCASTLKPMKKPSRNDTLPINRINPSMIFLSGGNTCTARMTSMSSKRREELYYNVLASPVFLFIVRFICFGHIMRQVILVFVSVSISQSWNCTATLWPLEW